MEIEYFVRAETWEAAHDEWQAMLLLPLGPHHAPHHA